MITDAQGEALYNYAREFRYCDVLIDPLAGQEWRDCLQDLPERDVPKVILRHEYFSKDSDQAPLVLRLPLNHFDVLDALAGIAREQALDPARQTRSICAFIQSDLEPDRLARTLEKSLSLRVGGEKIYFRYFDPRVMHHLPVLLAPNGLAMSGIKAWGYFDWEGEWARHDFDDRFDKGQLSHAIHLSADEWKPFQAIEHFNAAIAGFKRAGIAWPVEETDRLRQTVAKTLALGIREPADVATYLVRSREMGAPLAQHPRWNEVSALLNSGMPLADVLDGLDLELPA